MRPYKACTPENTIYKIRTILKNLDIFTTEYHIHNDAPCHSCRVIISDGVVDAFDIGTNGKGMDIVYSLASAYAELMERLQNRVLWVGTKYLIPDHQFNRSKFSESVCLPEFRYFPDETASEISSVELKALCEDYAPRSLHGIDFPNIEMSKCKMYFADFYNCKDRKKERIPYHLIRMAASTTGMCAGNTPAEAILQGLNEIFERFVLQELYVKRLTPPSIPSEMFEGTEVYKRLKTLQKKYSWEFEIKDCSLGAEYPVIGLMLYDKKRNLYMFRLGADLSAEIALQRCFTEMFQGASKIDSFFKRILLDDDFDIRAEYDKNVVNSMGRYPRELISNLYSWEFKGFVHTRGKSDIDDLNYLNKWLIAKGFTLYVRDNSFTGFPTYHVYIPGLSDIDGSLYNLFSTLISETTITTGVKAEYNIKSLDKAGIERFLSKYRNSTATAIKTFPYNTSPLSSVNRCLLLALLSYKIMHYKEAYNYMDDFLKQVETENQYLPQYYYIVRDIFLAKSDNLSNAAIVSTFSNLYGEQQVSKAIMDLGNPDQVLDNFPLTTCFNCEKCSLRNSCGFVNILKLESRIQNKMKADIIEQSSLRFLFE